MADIVSATLGQGAVASRCRPARGKGLPPGCLVEQTLDNLDRRCASAQRALALVRDFSVDAGGADRLSAGAKQLVQRAAVLGVFIEACEVKWLQGQPIELLDYLAAVNAQRRIIEDLGAAARQARDIGPTLEAYSRQLEAAK
jgi:hypothetical protein